MRLPCITDKLTIRIASVNGDSAQSAAQSGVLEIRALAGNEFDRESRLTNIVTFAGCVITGVRSNYNRNSGNKLATIPAAIWGDPVIGIGEDAFYEKPYVLEDHVTISEGITFIEEGAFYNGIRSGIDRITLPNSVIYIGAWAFPVNCKIHIGANVNIEYDPGLPSYNPWARFARAYERNNKRGGEYEMTGW